MKLHSFVVITGATLATLVACAEPSTAPPLSSAFAKAAPGPSNVAAAVSLLPTGTAATTSIASAGDNVGEYVNGKCGVTATLFYAGSNDMIMFTDSPSAADKKCVGQPAGTYPRKITVTINGTPYAGTGVNLLNVGSITPGTSANRQVGLPLASGAPCVRVQFNLEDGGIPVSRSADGKSYAANGSAPARCVQSDGSYSMLGTLAVVASARNN